MIRWLKSFWDWWDSLEPVPDPTKILLDAKIARILKPATEPRDVLFEMQLAEMRLKKNLLMEQLRQQEEARMIAADPRHPLFCQLDELPPTAGASRATSRPETTGSPDKLSAQPSVGGV